MAQAEALDRAVFYARVSTEEEKQLNALEKQVQENKDIIDSMGWKLVDGYVDEGKSGTTTKRRNEYQRLLEDIENDKFDILVVKSQDRLQRNTFEWYKFEDKIVRSKIKLYFYLENKFYQPDEDELITGIRAMLAAQYSKDLSKKLNNSNKRRIEQAKRGERVNAMGNGQTYGYTIKDKRWVIVPEEAEIVRTMYELYLELHSLRKVRNRMNELGYRNKKGKLFTEEVIGRVIKNEMHKGWVILNRHHRDFKTKEIIQKDEEEWVIVKDDHEPIVSPEVWDAVNNEIQSHRNEGNKKPRGKRMGTDPLSGKMVCACCGKVLWKHTSKNTSGTYHQWYCSGKMGRGEMACKEPATISGVKLNNYLVSLADRYLDYSTIEYSKTLLKRNTVKWLEDLKKQLTTPNDNEKIEAEIDKLESKRAKLLDAYTEDLIGKDEFKAKREEIDKLIADKRILLAPVEENPDIKDIDETIRNIDQEIELLFADEAQLEENKVKFLADHIKQIIVCANGDACVTLDRVAGAFLFIEGGKAEMIISPPEIEGEREGDFVQFDRESMSQSYGRIYYERPCKQGTFRRQNLYRIRCDEQGGDW